MAQNVGRFNLSDVFISYSRADTAFIKRLDARFKEADMEVWVDYEDIAPSVDWWQEIQSGIEAASTFVFVISHNSIVSEICRREIDHALDNGKRFVPVLYRDVDLNSYGAALHPAISSHNWLYFREEDDFEQAFSNLLETLQTDFSHVREHTRLLVRAREWESRNWDNSALLQGTELSEATEWLKQAANHSPEPTLLQERFINASARLQRRRTQVYWSVGIVTSVFVILTIALFFARNTAIRQRTIAQEQTTLAIDRLQDSTQLAEASSLVSRAQVAFELGDSYTALPFAVNATSIRDIPSAQMMLADIAYHVGASYWINQQTDDITAIAVSPIDPIIALASRDDTVVLWDLDNAQMLSELTAHTSNVNGVDFSPDGQQVISAGSDGQLLIWDMASGELLNTITLDMALLNIQHHPISPYAAVVVQTEVNSQRIYELRLYHLQTRELIQTISVGNTTITAIEFAPDGSTIFIATQSGDVSEWDIAPLETIDAPTNIFSFHERQVNSIDFSANGEEFLLASNDHTISVWNFERGRLTHVLTEHTNNVISADFVGDDNNAIFSISEDRNAILWEVSSSSTDAVLSGHIAIPSASAISADGRYAITGSRNGNAIVWDLAVSDLTQVYDTADTQITAIANTSDDLYYAVGMSTGEIRVWDATTHERLAGNPEAHGGTIQDMIITADNAYLISAGNDCSIRVWSLPTLTLAHDMGGECSFTDIAVGHTTIIRDLAINADGTQLLSASNDGDVIMWDLTTFEQSSRLDNVHYSQPIQAIAYTGDGSTAFASSRNDIFRFDLATGEITQHFVGHAADVDSLDVSADGAYLAASDQNRTVIIWETATSNASRILTGHRSPVGVVQFDETGNRLVSGSDDGVVLVWDLAEGDIVRRFTVDAGFVRSVAFFEDGQGLLFGGRELITQRLLNTDDLLRWVETHRVYRPLACNELISITSISVPLCEAEVTSNLLMDNTRQTGEIYLDSQQLWQFDAQAGETISISVVPDYSDAPTTLLTQARLNTVITIYAPDGHPLEIGNTTVVESETTTLEITETGTHLIEVGSFGGLTRGNYVITLERVATSSE